MSLDRPALTWGAVFCALGAAFLLEDLVVWQVHLGVLLPLLLIVAGIVLALSAAFPGARNG